MASSIVDQNIYKSGQQHERTHCEEEVLYPILDLFWGEAVFQPEYLGVNLLDIDPAFRFEVPEHKWGWDRIGLDHTDPSRVATALEKLHGKGFLTDRDIQETYYNRDVEEWRTEITEDMEFRATLPILGPNGGPLPPEEEAEDDETDKLEQGEDNS
jgi:hypothetical protein